MEMPELRIQAEENLVNEIDIEENLFEIKDKNNPDPARLVQAGKGKYLLRPKQCHVCLELFTPEDNDDTFCINCKEKGFTMSDVKIVNCKKCKKEFKKTHNRQELCEECRSKKSVKPKIIEAKQVTYKRNEHFKTLLESTFLTLQDKIVGITIRLDNDELITLGIMEE